MTSTKEQSKDFRKKMKILDPLYFTKSSLKWRNKKPKKALLKKAKDNAIRSNFEFNLTEEDLEIPAICPVLGTPLLFKSREEDWGNSPSIDRIDNSLGYVKGNVQVISWRANRLKADGSLEEFRRLVEWMEKSGT